MLSPTEFYNSLPPITKAYGTICVAATATLHLGLYSPPKIALFYELVWRLVAPFFFLGKFSINFGIHLLMLVKYGVQLEKSTFERRTSNFLWMMIFGALSLLVYVHPYNALSTIPMLWTPFLGVSLAFMLLYVWSREFPTVQMSIYGLAFYLPWAMLALDVIFYAPLLPNFLRIIAGHPYYFLTVLHLLASGRNILATPRWAHKLVARWRLRGPTNANVQPERGVGGAFTGRSYWLN